MTDRTTIIFAGVIIVFCLILIGAIRRRFARVIVNEFQAGLSYREGKFIEVLPAGAYWVWTPTQSITLVDKRNATLTLNGQEVVTADNIGVKLSCLLMYKVIDPARAINESQGWYQELYAHVQIAIRDLLSTMKLDEILQARSTLGDKLLEDAKPKVAKVGVELTMVQLKDIILPVEIRKIYGDIVRAQKEGQAALERARGEQAALRSLANAARLLEDNPALMNLRILQSLATQGSGSAPTVVLGVPGMIPLKNSGNSSTKSTPPPPSEE